MLKLKTCANKRARQTCQHVLSRTCECRTAHSHVSQPKNVRGKPRNFPFLKIATNNTRKIRPYPSRWRGVLLCLVFMVFTRQAKVSTCCTQTYKRYLSKHLSRKLSRTLSRKIKESMSQASQRFATTTLRAETLQLMQRTSFCHGSHSCAWGGQVMNQFHELVAEDGCSEPSVSRGISKRHAFTHPTSHRHGSPVSLRQLQLCCQVGQGGPL